MAWQGGTLGDLHVTIKVNGISIGSPKTFYDWDTIASEDSNIPFNISVATNGYRVALILKENVTQAVRVEFILSEAWNFFDFMPSNEFYNPTLATYLNSVETPYQGGDIDRFTFCLAPTHSITCEYHGTYIELGSQEARLSLTVGQTSVEWDTVDAVVAAFSNHTYVNVTKINSYSLRITAKVLEAPPQDISWRLGGWMINTDAMGVPVSGEATLRNFCLSQPTLPIANLCSPTILPMLDAIIPSADNYYYSYRINNGQIHTETTSVSIGEHTAQTVFVNVLSFQWKHILSSYFANERFKQGAFLAMYDQPIQGATRNAPNLISTTQNTVEFLLTPNVENDLIQTIFGEPITLHSCGIRTWED
ncbi:MAG: hypothetical protein RR677_06955 [Acinetobacter sp.]